MNNQIDNNRLWSIDVGAGIMILWMIIYHALMRDAKLDTSIESAINPCCTFPYLYFFMPWFFYKSGKLFKPTAHRSLLVKDTNKLLLTFLMWSSVGAVFFLAAEMVIRHHSLSNCLLSIVYSLIMEGYVPINSPLWFLLTLFLVRQIANSIIDRDKNHKLLVILTIITAYVFLLLTHAASLLPIPQWITNSLSGLCFFCIGYLMRDYDQRAWVIILSFSVYIIGCIMGFPIIEMRSNAVLSGSYYLWIPVSTCCIVAFDNFCRFLPKVFQFNLLSTIGRYAMPIYVTHMIILSCAESAYQLLNIYTIINRPIWFFLITYAICLPLVVIVYNIIKRHTSPTH